MHEPLATRPSRRSSALRSDDSLGRAAQLMSEYGVAHLAVIDPSTDRPSGVLSSLDLARMICGDVEH